MTDEKKTPKRITVRIKLGDRMTEEERRIYEQCRNVLIYRHKQTNFKRITQNEETLAEFIYCLQESFDYYAGNGAKKISQYAMEDANNKNHIELIHGNRDFDELMEWLKQESE